MGVALADQLAENVVGLAFGEQVVWLEMDGRLSLFSSITN